MPRKQSNLTNLKKKVRACLRDAEIDLVSPSRRIPAGVHKWATTYRFTYPLGNVRVTVEVDVATGGGGGYHE